MTTQNSSGGGAPTSAAQLYGMITGFMKSEMIIAAVKLGIADLLHDGPLTCDEMAAKAQTRPDTLYRLLRALAGIGIFAEVEGRRFQLTPLAEHLRTDAPNSLADTALYFDSEVTRKPWENLMHSLETGNDSFEHVFGEDHWAYFSKNEEAGQLFNKTMTNLTGQHMLAILEAFDFSGINTLVDVGGGNGTLVSAVLKKYPTMRGILQDLASPVQDARQYLAQEGVADRCVLVDGSFFESVVQGGDTYVLKWILHDWGNEDSLKILKSCRAAMGDGARLLVIDVIVPPGNEVSGTKTMDIHMLVINPGGRERTEAEFRELLEATGFHIMSITPTKSLLSIIEAVAV